MVFTPELFKYVFTQMIPEIILHSQSQDEEQVRGHYDRKLLRLFLWPLRLCLCLQVATTFTSGWYPFFDSSAVSLNVHSWSGS
jgi:hypothetical protein